MCDFLMIENGDGGEIEVASDGDIVTDNTFYSAVYLSLFGGRCFYEQLENASAVEKDDIESELNKPVLPDNLKNLANIINYRLNWMTEQGLAKSVNTECLAENDVITKCTITVIQPEGNMERFGIIWNREKSEIERFGEIYGRV